MRPVKVAVGDADAHSRRNPMKITARYEFASAHRLHDPALPPGENDRLYGSCARLHGHTYRLEVTLAGDRLSHGMLIDFNVIDGLVREHVIDRFDHRSVNDLPHFHLLRRRRRRWPVGSGASSTRIWPAARRSLRRSPCGRVTDTAPPWTAGAWRRPDDPPVAGCRTRARNFPHPQSMETLGAGLDFRLYLSYILALCAASEEGGGRTRVRPLAPGLGWPARHAMAGRP